MIPDTPTSPTFFDATSRTPTTMMASETPFERSLDQLQTPEQLKLLDTIDELQHKGLSQLGIDLPRLIVCGDQSSGKSSLLEGLTRLRFPIDDEQCTTFATEVVLRRELSFNITCTIIPGKSRSPKDREELSRFKQSFSSSKDFQLPLVIKDAKEILTRGLPKGQSGVVEDVLRVQYSGPDLPSLTIVDLPGMIEDKVEGADDEADRILELVTSYMRNEKTIILAVIHTGSHFDNQKVFKQLKNYDPQYKRTLGIITKPDRIDSGSPEEKKLIRVAKNEQYPFQHRWHAVRNRSSKHNKQSDTERDEMERQFFDTGLWACVRRQDVGIESLRVKLSRVLLEHVITELPSIVKAVQSALTSTRSKLKQLGDARETTKDQRSYLISHAQDFHSLTQDALRGVYTNPFFGISSPDKQSSARLRTAVQNLNMAFADVMIRKGNKWYIPADHLTVDQSSHFEAWDLTTQEYDAHFEDPQYKDRADFLENHIGGYVRQSRQAGLPSVINPLVIGEVFRDMSEKWRDIAKFHLRKIFMAIQLYVNTALRSIMDEYTFKLLMLKHVQPELDRRWEKVEEKLEELLVPYTEQDPLTYDPGFARTVKDLRRARYSVEQIPGALGKHPSSGFGQSNPSKPSLNRNQRLLTESLDEFTNSDILDLVTTYYKSATSVFISNVAVLAVENCLIKNLPSIFSAMLVADMDDAQLEAIAAESEETRCERSRLRDELALLETGKQILSEHFAKAFVPSMQEARQEFSQQVVQSRPRTPLVQPASQASERPERAQGREPETIGDLTSKLNNLTVTPPPSASNSRESSRRRVDSATATPSKAEMQRQRIRIQNVIERQPLKYESDSEF